jgi:hypothetical protein
MNIKDILSKDEQVLFKAQQHRLVPGGKETAPGEIFITTQRVIIETSKWLGIKKEYQDLHYSDILGIDLKQNVFSDSLVIRSRFQGEIHLNAIGKKEAQKMEQIISEGANKYRYGYGGGNQDDSRKIL